MTVVCGLVLAGCTQSYVNPPGYVNPAIVERFKQEAGTNYLGVYDGKMAERWPPGGVFLFSAYDGETRSWMSWEDFIEIFVLKTKPQFLLNW